MGNRLMSWFTRAASTVTFSLFLTLTSWAQAPNPNAAALSGQVSSPYGQPAVSASVRICPITASQATCTPLAQLYTNSALTAQQPNPVSTDAYGNYKVFVNAGLYLIQVTVSPSVIYTYYASAGSSSAGGGSAPPVFAVQYASTATGQFGSDATIFINPTQHILQTNELFVPGTGSGQVELGGQTSGQFVIQTVSDTTQAYTFIWPNTPPPAATSCLTANASGVGSWQSCALGGNFLPLTGGTLTGGLTGTSANFQSTNTLVNAALDPTTGDIGAKITHAISTCAGTSSTCSVYVPAGSGTPYTFSTTISIPLNQFSAFSLILDQGAVLHYTGTGDAIQFPVVAGGGPGEGNCRLTGGFLIGNSSAVSGVHLYPTNTCNITDMFITQFTTGLGVWNDGANAVNITHNLITNNRVGVYTSTNFCNQGGVPSACADLPLTGNPFTPNATHIQLNTITGNSQWGVESSELTTSGSTGALNVVVRDNDLELNGSAGSNFGSVFVGRSHGLVVDANYFEGSPQAIVLGIAGGADVNNRYFASQGPVIRDNYFTLGAAVVAGIQINLLDTADAVIEGNATLGANENSSSCFINTLVNNGANIGETGTWLGKNHFETDINFSTGNYTCVGGVPGPLVGAGTFPLVNSNYQAKIVDFNYALTSSGTSETVAIAVNTSSGCWAAPFNPTAGAALASGAVYVIPTGPNTATFFHPSGQAGTRWNIFCTIGPYN